MIEWVCSDSGKAEGTIENCLKLLCNENIKKLQYYFFLKRIDFEDYHKKSKSSEDLRALDEQVGRFILSENLVAVEGNEEIKYEKYTFEQGEGANLDSLFAFLHRLESSSFCFPDHLSNILRIAESFFCSGLLKSPFMKYLFGHKPILCKLVECSANYQAAMFIQKLVFHKAKAIAATEHQEFCFDKIELCRSVFRAFIETDQIDLYDNLYLLVLKKLVDCSSDDELHDAATIIDCAILAKPQARLLFDKLVGRLASHGLDDAKTKSLMEFLTSVCCYLQKTMDDDDLCDKSFMSNNSSSPRPERRKYSLDPSDIAIECEKPCVLAEDEFVSLLEEHICVVLALIPAERKVDSSSAQKARTHISPAGQSFAAVGFNLLSIFKFVTACCGLKSRALFYLINEHDSEVLEVFRDIFLSAPTNSIIHNEFRQCVTSLLRINCIAELVAARNPAAVQRLPAADLSRVCEEES